MHKELTRRSHVDLLLNFLYDHIAKSGDHQARIKWEPMSMALWVRLFPAHHSCFDTNTTFVS
jgi:sulfonate dioxygenase